MRSIMMDELTWPEVEQAIEQRYVPILVVGATEQHGPHLPLSTDTLLPVEIAKAAAERLRMLVVPPLPYGFKSKALSGGGQGFVGTTSLDGETLIHVVRDVVAELGRHGFREMAVMNWHMENINFMWEGVDQARRRGAVERMRVMSIDSPLFNAFEDSELEFLFADGFPGWDLEHAAIVETSMMIALRPDLVHDDLIADDRAAEHPWYDLVPEPSSHVAPSGVLSKATLATREKGQRLFDMIVDKLVEAVQAEFRTASRDGAGAR